MTQEFDVRGGADRGACPHAWGDPWKSKDGTKEFSDCLICHDRREEPKFKVSYDMESEYTYKGKTYRVRVGAHKSNTRSDYFQTIVKCVGTVMHRDTSGFHEFPDAEVVALFSERLFGVPIVGAKWSEDFSDVLYQGERAPSHEDAHGSVYMTAYTQKLTDFWDRKVA